MSPRKPKKNSPKASQEAKRHVECPRCGKATEQIVLCPGCGGECCVEECAPAGFRTLCLECEGA